MLPGFLSSLPRSLIILWLFISLSACGFYFRGYKPDTDNKLSNKLNIVLSTSNAERIKQYIYSEFVDNELILVAEDEADLLVYIYNEHFDKRILSLSAKTGKVREYGISYKVSIRINAADTGNILSEQTLSFEQDYIYDSDALLAVEREESLLRKELVRTASRDLLRRLKVIVQRKSDETDMIEEENTDEAE